MFHTASNFGGIWLVSWFCVKLFINYYSVILFIKMHNPVLFGYHYVWLHNVYIFLNKKKKRNKNTCVVSKKEFTSYQETRGFPDHCFAFLDNFPQKKDKSLLPEKSENDLSPIWSKEKCFKRKSACGKYFCPLFCCLTRLMSVFLWDQYFTWCVCSWCHVPLGNWVQMYDRRGQNIDGSKMLLCCGTASAK